MPIPDCLTDEQLNCLIAGDLDPIASVDWIEHVDECDQCQQRLDLLSRTSPPLPSDDSLPGELSRLSFSNTSASPSIADELLNAIEVKMQRDSSTVPNDSGAFMTKAIHSRGAPDRIGPYAIVKRLAIGGMSTVYEGRHVNLGRSVAIKLLGHGSRFSRTSAKQVLSEWRAHGRLSHPGIVVATDAGVAGGAPYLVTELIDGFDLAATVKTIGPLGASDAAALIGKMASALGYAHREGVAHLDIKPSNVMLDQDGNVKVLDLGTAQVSQLFPDEVAAQAGNASSSSLFGTLAFMAPERTRAKAFSSNHSSFDALVKADLYSLGCTWHFLLTGQAPFGNVASGDTPGHSQNELIQSHCHQAPASIVFDSADPASDDVRERTEILYQRLLAKRPADRPDDMQSVAQECQDIAGGAKLSLVARRIGELRPSEDAVTSGQTLQLSELVVRLGRTPIPFKRIAMLMILIAACVWMLWPNPPSPITSTNTAASAAWNWTASTNLGVLSNPTSLLAAYQESDPTVASVYLETVALRHPPSEIKWSSDGRWIAVLTREHLLRIYRWQNNQLTLQHVIKHSEDDGKSDVIVTFDWSPRASSLVVALPNRLAILDVDTQLNWRPQSHRFGAIRQVQWVSDQEQNLILVRSDQSLDGWDLQQESVIELGSPKAIRLIARSHSGDRWLGVNEETLFVNQTKYDGANWKTSTVAQIANPDGKPFKHLAWSWDDKLVSTFADAVVQILSSEALQIVGSAYADASNKGRGGFAWFHGDNRSIQNYGAIPLQEATRWLNGLNDNSILLGESSEPSAQLDAEACLVFEAALMIKRFRIPLHRRAKEHPTGKRDLASDGSAASLGLSVVAIHPENDLLAVASAGRMEIWDPQFRTIASTTATARIVMAQTMQQHSEIGIFAADGSVALVAPDGKLEDRILPPPNQAGPWASWMYNYQAIVEPELKLVQSTGVDRHPIGLRDLASLRPTLVNTGLPSYTLVPNEFVSSASQLAVGTQSHDRRTWRNVSRHENDRPRWNALLKSSDPRLFDFDPQTRSLASVGIGGDYFVASDQIDFKGTIPGELGKLSVAWNGPLKMLFASGLNATEHVVHAIDVANSETRWSRKWNKTSDKHSVARLADGNLLVIDGRRWSVLDSHSGDSKREIDIQDVTGLQFNRASLSPHDGKIYSWIYEAEIAPIACWSGDLELQWLAWNTGPHHWIVVGVDGRIIDLAGDSMNAMDRIIRPEIFPKYRPHFKNFEKSPTALCVVQRHIDGHHSVVTFDSLPKNELTD